MHMLCVSRVFAWCVCLLCACVCCVVILDVLRVLLCVCDYVCADMGVRACTFVRVYVPGCPV